MSDKDQKDSAPKFQPPYGGAIVHITNPHQHHGYRHMVAWCVSLGATSREYILGEIEKAKKAEADAETIYQVHKESEHRPGEWITVADLRLSNPEAADQVQRYVDAMVDYEERMAAYHKRPTPPRQNSYTLTFPASVSVVVQAPTLAAAYAALTPREDTSGHEIKQADPHIPGTMRIELDRAHGTLIATDDPKHQQPPAERRAPLSV
ncbi:hypothetical protein [Streptomyces sp. NPDC057002]|uniref:hypothetical protein n=1 Tax=Streptomyces sp. NPDC057002 TaxID=3345992 RepID=UPI003627344B